MLIITTNCFYLLEQRENKDLFPSFINDKNQYSKRTTNNDQNELPDDILKYHKRNSSELSSQKMFNEIFNNFTKTELQMTKDKESKKSNSFFNTNNIKQDHDIKNFQLKNLDNIKSSIEAISSEVNNSQEQNDDVKMVNQFEDELDLPKFNKWKIISKSELESSTQAKLISRKTIDKNTNNSISKSKSMEINSKDDQSNSSMNFNMLFEGDELKQKNMDFDVPENYQINLKDKNGNMIKTLQYKKEIEQPKYIYWRVNKEDLGKIKKLKPNMYEDLYALPGYVVLKDPNSKIELKSVLIN